MLKIVRDGESFRVLENDLGVRMLRVKARDLEELKMALDHYYGGKHSGDGYETGCPLCRQIQEEEIARRKRAKRPVS